MRRCISRNELLNWDSEAVQQLFCEAVDDGEESLAKIAVRDLLDRGDSDVVKEMMLSMLANDLLVIGDDFSDNVIQFVLDNCDKSEDLFSMCSELASCESLYEFIEARRLFKIYLPDTGECCFVS